jgi:hypothetical protein
MKITNIEEAIRKGPFNRFSRYRESLLVAVDSSVANHVFVNGHVLEASSHTDVDLIREVHDKGLTIANLQYIVDLMDNPALANIKYKEFVISTPDDAAREELKNMVEPYRLHKGTLIEPIYFNGRIPIQYRVVAYDDLINLLRARYQTTTINVTDDNGVALVPEITVIYK